MEPMPTGPLSVVDDRFGRANDVVGVACSRLDLSGPAAIGQYVLVGSDTTLRLNRKDCMTPTGWNLALAALCSAFGADAQNTGHTDFPEPSAMVPALAAIQR